MGWTARRRREYIPGRRSGEEAGVNNLVRVATVAVILALGMVLSAFMLSKLFVRIRHEQAITVKGYAETDVRSDVGRFYCTCHARGGSLPEAYGKLQDSRNAALAYLKRMGFSEAELAAGTIDTRKTMRRDAQGKDTNEIEYYNLSQAIAVASTNVLLIRDVSTGITDLIREGIDIESSSPAFYVTDLKDTKLRLLARATEDGYARAVALAQNSRGQVGALMSAQQGVFQITERNSTDTSGYGEYDTSTIEKTAKAVVTLEYAVESRR
jgi:hypothetical protein